MNRNDLLDLIPAYAIDALDPDERAAVDVLLATDTEAQALLADYEAMSENFVLNVPQRLAPSHLRANLQSKLADQRTSSTTNPQTEQQASRLISFPMILSAAAAILVVVFGILFLLPQTGGDVNPNEVLFNQLLDASGTSRFSIVPESAENVSGELLVSADMTSAVIRISSLPDTTSEESYQLWLITEEQIQSGGVFHWETGHGPYYVAILPETINSLVEVGMSIEPFEGSPLGDAPTGDRLFAVSVASAN